MVDEIQTETKITTQTIIVIHGLGKFTNHSIQVGAFTQVGDGVFSSPLYCATEEDGLSLIILAKELSEWDQGYLFVKG